MFLAVLVSLALSSLHGRAAASGVPEFYLYGRSEAVGDRGTIVRAEAVANAVAGGKGYRVLYRTLSSNKKLAIASTLIFVPDDPSRSPLGTAVWVHRTTGIRPRCAPSILDDRPGGAAFSIIPGLSAILAATNVVVAPDLLGLGATARDNVGGEVHSYLIADPSADAVLDAVKASSGLSEHLQKEGAAPFVLSGDVVLFGHSEGSFAVLASLPASEDLPADRWRLRGFAVSAPPAYVTVLHGGLPTA